jgi:hypothetical protein
MMHKIRELESDELPFINTKIGGALIDFDAMIAK